MTPHAHSQAYPFIAGRLQCVGDCKIVSIGGDHCFFYVQKPQQVADSILDFLAETEE